MKILAAFQAVNQGILICDDSCHITFFNKAYEDHIGVSLKIACGKPLSEYLPEDRVPEVIETGTALEGLYTEKNGKGCFMNIYPVFEDGRITGSISILNYVDLIRRQMPEEIHQGTLAERVRVFEAEEIRYMMATNGCDVTTKKEIAKELGISLATLYNKLR